MKLNLAIIFLLAALTSSLHAEVPAKQQAPGPPTSVPWRVKITSLVDGELIAWPKNRCGAEIADHVRRVVLKYPYVEVIDGKMAARIDEKRPVLAHRQVLGDAFTAFYDLTETRTIAFTIRWKDARSGKDAKDGTVPVEVSIIAYGKPGDRDDPVERAKACRETWLGNGKRI